MTNWVIHLWCGLLSQSIYFILRMKPPPPPPRYMNHLVMVCRLEVLQMDYPSVEDASLLVSFLGEELGGGGVPNHTQGMIQWMGFLAPWISHRGDITFPSELGNCGPGG